MDPADTGQSTKTKGIKFDIHSTINNAFPSFSVGVSPSRPPNPPHHRKRNTEHQRRGSLVPDLSALAAALDSNTNSGGSAISGVLDIGKPGCSSDIGALGGIPRSSSAPPEFFEEFARDIRLRRRVELGTSGGAGGGVGNVGGNRGGNSADDGGLFGDIESTVGVEERFVGAGRRMLLGNVMGSAADGKSLALSRSSIPIGKSVGAVGDRVPPRSFSTTELGAVWESGDGKDESIKVKGKLGRGDDIVSSQSVLERIQQDFPRTPSPVHELAGAESANSAESSERGKPRLLAPIPIPGLPKEFTNVTGTRAGSCPRILGGAKSTDDIPTRPHMSPPKQHRRASSINWSADLPMHAASSLKKPMPRVPSSSMLAAAAAAAVTGASDATAKGRSVDEDRRKSPSPSPSVEGSPTGTQGDANGSLGVSGQAHFTAADSATQTAHVGGRGSASSADEYYRGSVSTTDQYMNPFEGQYPVPTGHRYVGDTATTAVNGDLTSSLGTMNLSVGLNGTPVGFTSPGDIASVGGINNVMNVGAALNSMSGMGVMNGLDVMSQVGGPTNMNFSQEDLKLLQMAAFVNAQQQVYVAHLSQNMMGPNGSPSPNFVNGVSPTLVGGDPYAAYSSSISGNGLFPRGNASSVSADHNLWDQSPASAAARAGYPGGMAQRSRRPYGNHYRGLLDATASVIGGTRGRGGRYRRHSRHGDGTSTAAGKRGLNGNASGLPRSALLDDFRATSASIGRAVTVHNDVEENGGVGANGRGRGLCDTSGGDSDAVRKWELTDIKGHVVEFSTDQYGSRFIQQKLESASAEDVESVLAEVVLSAQRLMTDVFGNYVVQKLLDHGGNNARKAFADKLQGQMLSMSFHMYGCRVVQKLLEVLDGQVRARLVNELDGHVLRCIRDQNGNHVIQKCIELVDPESVLFIVKAVEGQTVVLAEHAYGCRVVQRILEHSSPEQKAPIMREIVGAIPNLIRDQYGNYVIQHVVEHGSADERAEVVDLVEKKICELSRHKFASNVVERCLEHLPERQREKLVEILITGREPHHRSPLNQLIRDQFGNYVVQRMLDVANPSQRKRIAEILKLQIPLLRKFPYGKHIIARLEGHWAGVEAGRTAGHMSSNELARDRLDSLTTPIASMHGSLKTDEMVS